MSTFDHRPDIDGLRAISVIPVILFHGNISLFSGGYVGVDIFFVISGYLISRIILQKIENGTFTFSHFFESRVRRIVPALIVLVLFCIVIFFPVMIPEEFLRLSWSSIYTISFLSNFYFYETVGYFTQNADQIPLLHTWSLGVEAQFYAVFPFFVALLYRRSYATLVSGLVVATLVSFILCIYVASVNSSIAFFYFPMRGWELGVGSLLACYDHRVPRNTGCGALMSAIVLVGITFIGVSVVVFDQATAHPGWITLVPVVGAILVIYAAPFDNFIGRLLASRPLVLIGLASYSAYLIHQPLFAYLRIQMPDNGIICETSIVLVGTAILSVISYKFIECPFRKSAIVSRKRLVGFLIIAMFGVGSISVASDASSGFERHYVSGLGDLDRTVYEAVRRARASDGFEAMLDDGACRFWTDGLTDETISRFSSCAEGGAVATIVFGDSHAMDLYNAVYLNFDGDFLVGLAQPGCRVAESLPHCGFDQIKEFLTDRSDRIAQVLFTEKGSYFLNDREAPEVAEHNVIRTLDFLDQLAAELSTVWVGPQIEPRVPFDLRRLRDMSSDTQNSALATALNALDQSIDTLVHARRSSVSYISKIEMVGFDFSTDFFVDGEFTYADETHWSIAGERLFGARLISGMRKQGFFTE
ncbi:MAG: acyltransferase family protein [Alphaproteobacteria bacterium]